MTEARIRTLVSAGEVRNWKVLCWSQHLLDLILGMD